MHAVIFEGRPAPGQRDPYLQVAARLRSGLEQMDGFISVERFQSLADPDKMLSLSFWRDEAALTQWRQREAHRRVQTAGRQQVFADYRLRVVEVVRDYGMNEREQAPGDSRVVHG
ncbi:MAG: antibiotic biosynthesis monooxygenase [Proteobacteria bacterium]|nr:antibiotic biosynthesis monooxygenase [Pseudomonadota bacterium]